MTIPLASPVYTLGPWQGNVSDDWGVDWIVESEDGWSASPPVRPTLEDKTIADGSWAGPGFYGSRVVSLSGKAIARDQMSMLLAKERLKAAVGPRALTSLVVEELHLSRKAAVRLTDQMDITDAGARAFNWTIILTAADPRRYSVDSLTGSTGLPSTSSTGRTYPRTYPRVYGGATPGGPGSVFLQQAGDFDETPAVIVFYGPVISPQVAHPQTDRQLTFGLTVGQGESLVVDLAAETALLNGTASRVGTISPGSAWFMLTPGSNELQFRGQAGPTSNDTTPLMTVTAASAWT